MHLPIRIRLALAYCFFFVVIVLVLEATMYLSTRAAINSVVDAELKSRFDGLQDYLERHIPVYAPNQLKAAIALHPAFEPSQLLIRKDGQPFLVSQSLKGLRINSFAGQPHFQNEQSNGRPLRLLLIRKQLLGDSYDVALAADLTVPLTILHRVWLAMLISGPFLFLIAGAAGYWIAGRALSPVRAIITAAHGIDATHLHERVRVPVPRDEIQQLAHTVNGMLQRIEDGFRQIRSFTADASHELRTPLSVIRATAEVALIRPPDPESQRRALQRILRESERNSIMLEQMLSLARMDARCDLPDRQLVDLNASVRESSLKLGPVAQEKGIRLGTHVHTQPRWASADPDALHRLWLILLDNAIKYTAAEGDVEVTLSTTNTHAICTVRDTGVGIAAEHLPHIFERFYRVDKARSRSEGGTGLGLAIASEIVKLHNGVIEVSSIPRVGSCFTVTLPLHRTSVPDGDELTTFKVNLRSS
jgi:heavy metal sensor kinase